MGLSLDMFEYVLGLFLAYPLAAVFALLPGALLKDCFALVSGVVMAQFVTEMGLRYV